MATLFPNGTITKEIEIRLSKVKSEYGMLEDNAKNSIIQQLIDDILQAYAKDPHCKLLPL